MIEIMINSDSKLELHNENEKTIISYKRFDENRDYSDFSPILSDDIIINAYTFDDTKSELVFDIESNNPLFESFNLLLKEDNQMIITSDYRREEYDDLCYVEFMKTLNH